MKDIPNIFSFQTAKTMVKISSSDNREKNQHCNPDASQENSSSKLSFQEAKNPLENSTSKKSLNENNIYHDLDDQIPFSKEQIKEFGECSNIMIDFQVSNDCYKEQQKEGLFNANAKLPDASVSHIMPTNQSLNLSCIDLFKEPVNTLEDINKFLSKYENSDKIKGPKKKVVFNKKNASKSKRNLSQESACGYSLPNPIENMNMENESAIAIRDGDKDKRKKIVFTRKQRGNDEIMKDKNIENNSSQTGIEEKLNVDGKTDDDKRITRKKVCFIKTYNEIPKHASKVESMDDEELFPNSDEEDFKDNEREDEDFNINDVKKQSGTRQKVVFKKPKKKINQGKGHGPDTLFKIPDTEKYLRVKQKTKRHSNNVNEESEPKKVLFSRSMPKNKSACRVNQKYTNECSRSMSKKSTPTKSQYSEKSKTQSSSKSIQFSPSRDARTELSELDTKPIYGILYNEKYVTKDRKQVIGVSSTFDCKAEKIDGGTILLKPKKTVLKKSQQTNGPPIKVPKCLPDLVGASTKGGQRIFFSLNEARPLLFQNKAAADWWDAATYTNFLRMKCQLESGEYIHPDLCQRTEEEVNKHLDQLENAVKNSVRDLETRPLFEKYILCQWEEDLVHTSGNIDEWLQDCFDMSPLAVAELCGELDHMLDIPVTFVMLKKTVYLAELYWNMCELRKGVWGRILSTKANCILNNFKENFQLSRPFSRYHYHTVLYDLIAEFTDVVVHLPYHQRIMITHLLEEELSWPRREVLILNTKPDLDEATLNSYEYTVNDQKNVFMLKLLLAFPNQISQPIFLSRNRIKGPKRRHPFASSNIETTSDDNLSPEIYTYLEEEDYDYYDEWNFKTKPKRIKRSVGGVKVKSVQNKRIQDGQEYIASENIKPNVSVVGSPIHYNTLETFNYDNNDETNHITNFMMKNVDAKNQTNKKVDSFEVVQLGNTTDLVNQEHTAVIMMDTSSDQNPWEYVEGHVKFEQGNIHDAYQMKVHNESFDIQHKMEPSSVDMRIVTTKEDNLLTDTLRILNDEFVEESELFLQDSANMTQYCANFLDESNYNQMCKNQFLESTSENNIDFDSQEMKLIYNILESENKVIKVSNESQITQAYDKFHASSKNMDDYNIELETYHTDRVPVPHKRTNSSPRSDNIVLNENDLTDEFHDTTTGISRINEYVMDIKVEKFEGSIAEDVKMTNNLVTEEILEYVDKMTDDRFKDAMHVDIINQTKDEWTPNDNTINFSQSMKRDSEESSCRNLLPTKKEENIDMVLADFGIQNLPGQNNIEEFEVNREENSKVEANNNTHNINKENNNNNTEEIFLGTSGSLVNLQSGTATAFGDHVVPNIFSHHENDVQVVPSCSRYDTDFEI